MRSPPITRSCSRPNSSRISSSAYSIRRRWAGLFLKSLRGSFLKSVSGIRVPPRRGLASPIIAPGPGVTEDAGADLSSAALRSDDGIGKGSDPLHRHAHRVAGFPEHRGLASKSHTGRRTGGYQIPYLPGDRLREIADQEGNLEDQVARVGILHRLAIEPEGDSQVVGIRNFIGSDNPRAGRREGVAALPAVPLFVAKLHVARAHVVK